MTGSTQEDPSLYHLKIVDGTKESNQTNKHIQVLFKPVQTLQMFIFHDSNIPWLCLGKAPSYANTSPAEPGYILFKNSTDPDQLVSDEAS